MTDDIIADVLGLVHFIDESNRIEGINRKASKPEIDAHIAFLSVKRPNVGDLVHLVGVLAGAQLRDQPGMNVVVGNHVPPPGGADIPYRLGGILARAFIDPSPDAAWGMHCQYETLHPFMDGNGRSGRALWLWMMLRTARGWDYRLSFLHAFYYQTLANAEWR